MSPRGTAARDRSRTGFDEPTTSSASPGRASTSDPGQAQTARCSRGVERGVERLGRGPVGVEPARHPAARGVPRRRGPDRADGPGDVGPAPALRVRQGVDGDAGVGEQPLDRPVQGRAARHQHLRREERVRERAQQPRTGAQADVPHPRRRFGDHRQPPVAHLRRGSRPGNDQRRDARGRAAAGRRGPGPGTPRSTDPLRGAQRGAFPRRAPAAPRTAGSCAPARGASRARPPAPDRRRTATTRSPAPGRSREPR